MYSSVCPAENSQADSVDTEVTLAYGAAKYFSDIQEKHVGGWKSDNYINGLAIWHS